MNEKEKNELHKKMRIQHENILNRKKELIKNSNIDFESLIYNIQKNKIEEKPIVGKSNKEIDFIITSASRIEMIKCVKSFMKKVIFSGKFNMYLHEDVVPGMERESKELVKWARESNLFKKIIVTNPRQGRGPALNKLKPYIKTDFIFYTEEDFEFMRYINVDKLIDIMEKYKIINQIGFSNRYWPIIPKPGCNGDDSYFYEPREFDDITLLVSERWLWFPSIWRKSFIWKYWNFSSHKTNHSLNKKIKGNEWSYGCDCDWLEEKIGSYLLDGIGENPWINAYLYHLCPHKRHDRNFL